MSALGCSHDVDKDIAMDLPVKLLHASLTKFHFAIGESKQGEISAAPDILSGKILVSALSHDYISRNHRFPTEFFHAEALGL